MTMERYRYGTKEIIATVLGVAILVLSIPLEGLITSSGVFPPQLFDWITFRVLIVAVVAVFFGPIVGIIVGVGGNLLVFEIYETSVVYPEVIVLGLYGLSLGWYFGKRHLDISRVTSRTIFDFNVIQVTVSIMLVMFLAPLLQFLFGGVKVYDAVVTCARWTAGNCILVGVVCSILICVVSLITRSRQKRHGA